MSVAEKMIVLADSVRSLTGTSELLSLDEMASQINERMSQDSSFYAGETTSFCNPYITSIRDRVFRALTWLTAIDCPNVKTVGEYAFQYCQGLTGINLPACESLADGAFYDIGEVTRIELPSLISTKPSAFRANPTLETVYLPKLEILATSAFNGCTALKSIELPSLTNLGSSVFEGCDSLEYIVLGGDSVVSMSGFLFAGTQVGASFKAAYVKDELVEQYKVATNWSYLADYITPKSEFMEETV